MSWRPCPSRGWAFWVKIDPERNLTPIIMKNDEGIKINLTVSLPSSTHLSVRHLLMMEMPCVFINQILIQGGFHFTWTPSYHRLQVFLAKNQNTHPDFFVLFLGGSRIQNTLPYTSTLCLCRFGITRVGLLLFSRVCSKCLIHFFFFFLTMLCSIWDLRSQTRGWTSAPCRGSAES